MNNNNNTKYTDIEKIHKDLLGYSDEKLLALGGHSGEDILKDTKEASDRIEFILNTIFDDEDRAIYNKLLGRKPISYDFRPSNRKRVEAIFAIMLNIS